MTGKHSFEEQFAALDQLRHLASAASINPLRKVLTHGNNYIVSKAADFAREFRRAELIPDLLGAFVRFFTDPVRCTDTYTEPVPRRNVEMAPLDAGNSRSRNSDLTRA